MLNHTVWLSSTLLRWICHRSSCRIWRWVFRMFGWSCCLNRVRFACISRRCWRSRCWGSSIITRAQQISQAVNKLGNVKLRERLLWRMSVLLQAYSIHLVQNVNTMPYTMQHISLRRTGWDSGIRSLSSLLEGGYWVSKALADSVAVFCRVAPTSFPTRGRQWAISVVRSQVSKAVAFHFKRVSMVKIQISSRMLSTRRL